MSAIHDAASGNVLRLYIPLPVAVLRGLSAMVRSYVFIETPECSFRPTLGLYGLIA
jgi:hypothetical protein